ncbi:MAG: Protein of unknown function (DUF2497) [Rhodobacteraceae bacterium HLUCCO07]|nr:MAG: Protein of unknown function (DUF2497) [Rhodobacteraceae bacterium HLUCCO07]
MNDPVTNVEIEDVLSSIRRLVSENGRNVETRPSERNESERQLDTEKGSSASAGKKAQDDMLVLTPALRVPDPEVADAPASGSAVESDASDRLDETALQESATGQEDDASTEGGQALAAALESVVRHALDGAMDKALSQESDDRHGPEPVGANAGDPAARAAEAGESLKQRITELEAVVAQQEGDWEPDGDDREDAYAGTPVEPLAWEDHFEDLKDGTDSPDHVWQEDRMGEVEEAELVMGDADDVGAGPEPVFEHVSRADETTQDPARVAREEFSREALEDNQPQPANAEPDTGDSDASDQDEPIDEDVDLFGADATLIDEEMLREMVADIVRQELQGTLGERITRNVRKLVRREIHRALAAHELD